MRKILLFLAFSFLSAMAVQAQISGPSTASAGTPVTFTGPSGKFSYTWSVGPLTLNKPATGTLTRTTINSVTQASHTVVCNDNGQWYAFSIRQSDRQMVRVDLGSDPTAPSTTVAVLGNFMTTTAPEFGFDIIKDTTSGNWYGFVVQTGNVAPDVVPFCKRLDFGTSLANTPTAVPVTFPSNTGALICNVNIVKYNNEWELFIGNRWGAPIRVDLGTNITNTTPSSAIQLPALPVAGTTAIAVYQQGSSWYGLTVGTGHQNLYRYNFGADLKNNTPAVSTAGSNIIGNSNNWNVKVVAGGDCGSDLFAYVTSGNNLRRLEFPGGDITATPINSGALLATNFAGTLSFGLYPYVYNGTLQAMFGCYNDNSISNVKLSDLPSGTQHKYRNPSVSYTFPSPGTYTVNLITGMDGGSAPEQYCHTVNVVAAGPAQPGLYTAAPSAVCRGQQAVTYTVPAVSGADEYHWQYTGNNVNYTASTTQPSNSLNFLANATNGTLRVWAVDNNGDSSTSSRDTAITATPLPSVSISPATATICAGGSIQLTASGATTYSWSPSGGSSAAATVSPATTTTYTVTGTSSGCSATASREVTVTPLPTVSISPVTASVCAGAGVTLTASGATTYSWSHSGGNAAAATFTPTATTTYTVTGTSAGCSSTATRQVVYHTLPVTQVTGGITEICTGDSVVLTASGSGYSYEWKDGSGVVGTGSSYAAYTTGSYKVVATDIGSGCSDSTQAVDIRVYAPPVVSLDHNDTSFCIGGVVTLEVSTQDTGLTYVWKQDEVTISLATADFLEINESGVYKVIVGRSQVAGCADSTNEVRITVHDLPVVNTTWDGEALHATPGYASYQWNTGSQGIPGATDSTYTPSSNGSYSVTVTDGNGCENTSAVQNLTGVGMDVITRPEILVYPNPSDGVVYIQSPVRVDVLLLGMDGRVLLRVADARKVELGGYAAGIYLLRILDAQGMVIGTERLMKQ